MPLISIPLKKYKLKAFLIAIILAVTGSAGYVSTSNSSSKKNIPKIDPEKFYEVSTVADGDTFSVKVEGKTVKVRMIGVDTPETVDPRKTVQCFGKEASDKTKEILSKHSVKLKTDPSQGISDKYGRLLAYVYTEEGLFVNKYLIENGYAHEYTYNIPYQEQKEFKELQKKAREEKVGLWGSLCLDK